MSATTERPPQGRSGDDGGRMPLLEHVRELRDRLIRAVLAILAGTAVAWFFYDPAIDLLVRPVCPDGIRGEAASSCALKVFDILGPFSLQLKISLTGGLILSSPIWIFQLWAFLAPGLHKNEKRWTYIFVAAGLPLFLGGAAVAYSVLPIAIPLLLGFTPGAVENIIRVDQYFGFVIRMLLVFGLAFLLPLAMVVANFAGALSGARIRSWWRGAVFGIFVFAAVATPTGDPLTMAALAAPLSVLYAVAMGIALLVDRRRARRAAAAEGALETP